MRKYITIEWPEIQKYQELDNFSEVGYDPEKDVWFVPEDMIDDIKKNKLWIQTK